MFHQHLNYLKLQLKITHLVFFNVFAPHDMLLFLTGDRFNGQYSISFDLDYINSHKAVIHKRILSQVNSYQVIEKTI